MLIDLIHRFRALFHSNAVESEWNEELRYHLDREAEKYRQATTQRRFQTTLLCAFAGMALFLGMVGVYGLLAYSVKQRTAEIGVRIAWEHREDVS